MSLRLIAVLACFVASALNAQPSHIDSRLADSSTSRIMARLTEATDVGWFTNLMRQTHKHVTQAKLDALGDSLVARELTGERSRQTTRTGSLQSRPVDLIAFSGNRGLREGTPYVGALQRLIRIHQQATDYMVRTAALAALPGVVGRERGLAYLKEVAMSQDTTSWYAINVLTIDATGGSWYGPKPTPSESKQSDAILHALFAEGAVRQPEAKRFLDRWALHKGY